MDFEQFKELESLELKKQKLIEFDKAYYELDDPIVTDSVYDECLAHYNSISSIPYESSLGAPSNAFTKFQHTYPVTSLAKINKKDQFVNIVEKFENNYVIQPKLDGLTIVRYPDGTFVSRGDGTTGEVIPFAHLIPNMPQNIKIDNPIRMEVYIDLKTYGEKYGYSSKNPRNIAAGILRRKEYTSEIKNLSYFAYNILGSKDTEEKQLEKITKLGFRSVGSYSIKGLDADKAYDEFVLKFNGGLLPTDGIVIKYNGVNGLEKFGATSHHPNNMVAYKFPSDYKATKLLAIEWSEGRDKITPVAIFEPVNLGGSVVTKASVHNLNILKKMGLKIGHVVKVSLKNEIIPQIIGIEENQKEDELTDIEIPKVCPTCGAELYSDDQDVMCINNKCINKVLYGMMRIVDKNGLNIVGLSEAIVKKILDKEIKELKEKQFDHFEINPFTILLTKENDFKDMGYTNKMATKLSLAISNAKKNVHPSKFLYACNVYNLGRVAAEQIMKTYDYDIRKFLDNFKETGKDIDGVGDVLYNDIVKELKNIEIQSNFVSFAKIEPVKVNKSQLTFVISGTLSQPRKFFEEEIKNAGHVFATSVTKNTSYLVTSETSGSKFTKATKLNIPIITEQKLVEMLNNEKTQ